MSKGTYRYEVRVQGDGDFEYFTIDASDGCGEEVYDPLSKDSATRYASKCNGWVVKITEEIVWKGANYVQV